MKRIIKYISMTLAILLLSGCLSKDSMEDITTNVGIYFTNAD